MAPTLTNFYADHKVLLVANSVTHLRRTQLYIHIHNLFGAVGHSPSHCLAKKNAASGYFPLLFICLFVCLFGQFVFNLVIIVVVI